jgi:hypothetical protein
MEQVALAREYLILLFPFPLVLGTFGLLLLILYLPYWAFWTILIALLVIATLFGGLRPGSFGGDR